MFSGEQGGEEFGDVGRQFRGLEYSYSLTHFVTHPFTHSCLRQMTIYLSTTCGFSKYYQPIEINLFI
jgi:hypothetical protein